MTPACNAMRSIAGRNDEVRMRGGRRLTADYADGTDSFALLSDQSESSPVKLFPDWSGLRPRTSNAPTPKAPAWQARLRRRTGSAVASVHLFRRSECEVALRYGCETPVWRRGG